MIFSITDEDVSILHDSQAFEAFEFSVVAPPAAKGLQESPIRLKDLDSIVSAVADKDVTLPKRIINQDDPECKDEWYDLQSNLIINGNASWKLELSFFGSFGAKIRHATSIDVENLNAMVVAVTDDNSVGITDGNIVRML